MECSGRRDNNAHTHTGGASAIWHAQVEEIIMSNLQRWRISLMVCSGKRDFNTTPTEVAHQPFVNVTTQEGEISTPHQQMRRLSHMTCSGRRDINSTQPINQI
jgi:Holliday junction resolvasome RuvABC ATP-dependent DNA helicase subunit